MSERQLYQKFKKKMLKADPSAWVYKIPDWIGGPKRPFDMILIMKGKPFAIEFKSRKGILTRYQAFQLTEFINAGGEALVYTEGQDMDLFIENMMRTTLTK